MRRVTDPCPKEDQVNVPLLRKAVEWAEAEAAKPARESQWNQMTWIVDAVDVGRTCGTCYCIAGYVAQLVDPRFETAAGMTSTVDYGSQVRGPHPRRVATKALGISNLSASWLFDAENTVAMIRHVAEQIVGGPL